MTLTAAGWSFLIVAWLAIGSLTAWCMARVLRSRGQGRGAGPD